MRVSNAAETLLAQHHLVRVAHAIELLPAEKRETPRYIYTHTHTHQSTHAHAEAHARITGQEQAVVQGECDTVWEEGAGVTGRA